MAEDLAVNNQLALTSLAVQGTNLTLVAVVPAGLGQVTLEMRPTLVAPWTVAVAGHVPSGGGEVTFTIRKPGEMQFFRLRAAASVESTGVVSAEVNYLTVAPLGLAAASPAGSQSGGGGAGSGIPLQGNGRWLRPHPDHPRRRLLGTRTLGLAGGSGDCERRAMESTEKNYLTTAGEAKFLPECFSLEAVDLERIKGRDVVALERTNNALIVYLDDTPVGAGEYEFKIHFHPARPKPAPARDCTAATLKIAAEIDGSDCLRITATEATWDHKHWGGPANVRLNEVPWSVQQTNVLQNTGTNQFLPSGVDF